jgi:hypothetical protein
MNLHLKLGAGKSAGVQVSLREGYINNMFQLTRQDIDNLRSQFATTSWAVAVIGQSSADVSPVAIDGQEKAATSAAR